MSVVTIYYFLQDPVPDIESKEAPSVGLKGRSCILCRGITALDELLTIGSAGETGLAQHRTNLESYILHQVVDRVAVLLPYLCFISFVHFHALA